MSKPERRELTIEDANIIFRNFGGVEKQYNKAGDRNFCLILDTDTATQMESDGWNVRVLEARDEGDEDTPYIQVAVRYDIRPPRVVMLTSTTRTQLDEGSVEILDWAEIKLVDLKVAGNPWEMNGKSGLKAYLQSMYITIEEDELDRKYNIYEQPATAADEEPDG